MHDSRDQTGNLLGAAALAVGELLLADATTASGTSASGAAALVVLSAFPGLGVTELGRRVGLSQPAAARMVDSLEGHGLVVRRAASGRSVAVDLTADGTDTARRILASRGDRLNALVDRLDDADRTALDDLLRRLLTLIYEDLPHADRLCRLCDRPACVADGATCPVGAAERARGRA